MQLRHYVKNIKEEAYQMLSDYRNTDGINVFRNRVIYGMKVNAKVSSPKNKGPAFPDSGILEKPFQTSPLLWHKQNLCGKPSFLVAS